MAGIDESLAFVPCNIAVLTVSDTRNRGNDASGDLLEQRLLALGHRLHARCIVRDDLEAIRSQLTSWIDDPAVQIVLSTGGTGVTARDVTPEAFESLYDKAIPGFGELFRWLSYQKIATSTVQSRATAGVASGTYLFALPGSTSACRDAWDGILAMQLDARHRPCNFIELLPRLVHDEKVGDAPSS
jgi:molybdopterin adenylyltransferase